jgi:plasmid replication initiation protein
MTRSKPTGSSERFDVFLPYVADMPLRDQREMMERPFFSLAKTKRTKPIDYTSPDGKLWVHVSSNPDYGMATIWDADILIYCASVLADMVRRGVNDVPRKLTIMPYDLLRAIGRPTTGRAYELLGQASIAWSRPRSRPTSAPRTGVKPPSRGSMAGRNWSTSAPSGPRA